MKKALSLILAVLMLLSIGTSLAETAEADVVPLFRVSVTVPDGYTQVDEIWTEPSVVYVLLSSEDNTKPLIDIQISYEDLHSDVTFNAETWDTELVQNSVARLSYDFETEQYDEYTTRETGLGTIVMIINEADYTRIMTIWHGYMLSMFVSDINENGDSIPVGEKSLDMIMQFLTDLDISDVIVEQE